MGKEVISLINKLEVEINKTPTGNLRNLLCDINIVLHLSKNQKDVLKKVFDLTEGAWDSVVISEELYDEMIKILK